ncbi:MAG: nucleotidyl transferase AbiEii/AbiGii toxin family protein [Candidatus Methanospirareceae archaeon]
MKVTASKSTLFEDLDFSSTLTAEQNIRNIIDKTLIEVNREGVNLRFTESKSTSGDYPAIIEGTVGAWDIRILINVSSRSQEIEKEVVMVTNPLNPSYLVYSLHEDQMVQETISALLTRKKPRDFFDPYFILRKGMSRNVVASYKAELLREIKNIDDKAISTELKLFLPRSYWPVLRDFRERLLKELERR